METALLTDVIVICGLALGVNVLCQRLAIPSIVGFLLTGIAAGPHGLGLLSRIHEVELLAEIGVVCLLFTVGLEFSAETLSRIKFISLLGGTIQVGASVAAGAGLAGVLGMSLSQAIFFGFLVSLSSTAIVLKILQERADIESPHGRLSTGILIFQDIAVVPMMLMAPILAGGQQDIATGLLLLFAKGITVFLAALVAAKWVVPFVLYHVARLRGRELFILVVVFFGLGLAWLTAAVGLSPALGAFLAGLIVSESEYSHRALGNVLPFRDLFISFFFVSIGMLLDLHFVIGNPFLMMAVTLCVVFLKFITAGLSAAFLGFPLRTAVLAGLALSQIGEFSFVLSEAGMPLGLMEANSYQLFLGVSVFTMVATPFIIGGGERAAAMALRLPFPQGFKTGARPVSEATGGSDLGNHLIIVGFGLNGRNLSRAASAARIPRTIIELNPDTVRREKAKGEPISQGDASHESVLSHAGIRQARVMVIVISDPGAARRIVDTARRLNPTLHIIARTRFFSETEPLYELGANEVIPEDYEASVEVLARVLTKYLVPRDEIEKFAAEFRADHYRMLRSIGYASPTLSDLMLRIPDVEIASLAVSSQSEAVGKSLSELDMRDRYGVTILAIGRGSEYIPNPSGSERMQDGDVAVVIGAPERIAQLSDLFRHLRKS